MLDLAGIQLEVREIPGHSPGHVFVVAEKPVLVLGGDVLFRGGSIGRTDFPAAALNAWRRAFARSYTLLDDTVIYPGHGPDDDDWPT